MPCGVDNLAQVPIILNDSPFYGLTSKIMVYTFQHEIFHLLKWCNSVCVTLLIPLGVHNYLVLLNMKGALVLKVMYTLTQSETYTGDNCVKPLVPHFYHLIYDPGVIDHIRD